jgi:D-alanine-D-alanine ligase
MVCIMTRVGVLHSPVTEGLRKDEDDVLIQAKVVCGALSKLGYEPSPVPFTSDIGAMMERLRAFAPAFVFNLVETVEGTGRFIYLAPAVLDQLGICYTGATTEAVFLTSNKIVAKRLLTGSAVATPLWHTKESLQNGCPLVPGTYIIKSIWEHGSVGLDDEAKVSVSSPTDLLGALQRGEGKLGGECFTETFVEGREFNLSLLEVGKSPQVLPPAEILFREFPPGKAKIVGYRAKWEADSFEYTHTPRCFDFSEEDAPLLDELAEIALTCWDLFALRGYARVDFRVDAANRPWVLEVNTNPCLSPDAGFVAATERAGLALEEVIEHIIAASRPATPPCR